jgi:hypothetical protein
MRSDDGVQVVPSLVRKKQSREFDGTKHLWPKIYTQALERGFDEAIVKAGVVRDKDLAFKFSFDLQRKFVELGLARHHFRRDACQPLDILRNEGLGIYQTLPGSFLTMSECFYADFGDPVTLGIAASSLNEGVRIFV